MLVTDFNFVRQKAHTSLQSALKAHYYMDNAQDHLFEFLSYYRNYLPTVSQADTDALMTGLMLSFSGDVPFTIQQNRSSFFYRFEEMIELRPDLITQKHLKQMISSLINLLPKQLNETIPLIIGVKKCAIHTPHLFDQEVMISVEMLNATHDNFFRKINDIKGELKHYRAIKI